MNKLLALTLACSLAILTPVSISFAVDTSAIQAQIDAIQAQRQELLDQQQKLTTALNELGKDKQSLTTNIKQLDATRTKLQNDLKITQSKIKESDLAIQKLAASIKDNESQVAIHEAAISEAMKKLSSYDSHTLIYDLLAYDNISDVWRDTANLSSVSDTLEHEIAELKDVETELAKNKADQEATKQSLASLAAQLSGQKKVVESTQSAKQKLLAETKNKEAAYQAMLAENKRQEAIFEQQLFQYESQLKAAAPGTAPRASHSILDWPVAKVRITQQFGKTSSSGRLYASGTHNGVDFGTPVGTPVMAVRGGVVKGMGNTDSQPGCYSYGRWILIEHDNGLSTIYGHLSAAVVSTGQAVAGGQVIGYSGGQPGADGSGYSTGPHLHLGLFVTAGVHIQQYTTSIGCKNVAIPIANPTDYLDPLAYLPSL